MFAQDDEQYTLRGVVMDSLNAKAVPFVSISKSRDRKGTISDFEGNFILENVHPGDTIHFSSVGFERQYFTAQRNTTPIVFYMHRAAQIIDEVVVLADNSILYDLVYAVKKSVSNNKHQSKTYFELETYYDQQQLELFQGYYNGTYQSYNTIELDMKTGRFALAPIEKRLFASTETSKAFCLHTLQNSNQYFPVSPFELSKRRLRKDYSLLLNSKYMDADGRTIYIISFKPRAPSGDFFSGQVWIDSTENQIHKVKLEVSGANVYPFLPLWPKHELNDVNMQITKAFTSQDGDMVLASSDFNYSLNYLSNTDSSISISTRAVLYPYNYSSSFQRPFFEFQQTSHSDYRRIQMLPYYKRFWACEDEFQLTNNKQQNNFVENEATIKTYNLFSSDTLFSYNFFENPYVTWNGNRILFKGLSADSATYYDKTGQINTNRYRLYVQLYADINSLCDTVEVITKTVFDPYVSYYHFETTKESQAFINIYFDLMELERRKLAQKLELVKGDRNAVEKVYAAALAEANEMSETYFKEMQRGTNLSALKKWNEHICLTLGIDNMYLFGIEVLE